MYKNQIFPKQISGTCGGNEVDTMCMDGSEEFALEVVDIIRDGKYYDPDIPILPEAEDFDMEYAIFLQGLEEELGIIIPDEVAELFCNLGDVVEFVKKQMEVNNNGISA